MFKACILTVFETILNCRENMKTLRMHSYGIWKSREMETMYQKHVFLRYLKRFGRKLWKQWNHMVHYAAVLYDILKCREHFEGNVAKWCIPALFVTYAWRILGTRKGITPPPTPPTPSFWIAKIDFLFFLFFKCTPGPTGAIGATPV